MTPSGPHDHECHAPFIPTGTPSTHGCFELSIFIQYPHRDPLRFELSLYTIALKADIPRLHWIAGFKNGGRIIVQNCPERMKFFFT